MQQAKSPLTANMVVAASLLAVTVLTFAMFLAACAGLQSSSSSYKDSSLIALVQLRQLKSDLKVHIQEMRQWLDRLDKLTDQYELLRKHRNYCEVLRRIEQAEALIFTDPSRKEIIWTILAYTMSEEERKLALKKSELDENRTQLWGQGEELEKQRHRLIEKYDAMKAYLFARIGQGVSGAEYAQSLSLASEIRAEWETVNALLESLENRLDHWKSRAERCPRSFYQR